MFLEWEKVKAKINNYLLASSERPKNFKFLCRLHEFLTSLSARQVKVDLGNISNVEKRTLATLKSARTRIEYDMFGTKTGRLSTCKGGFPILNLRKEHRTCLSPNNDFFVELDYNAAELRVLLSLNGKSQPQHDIHESNAENVFKSSREQAKIKVFSWLYDDNKTNKKLEEIYNKKKIKEQFYDGYRVHTPTGRILDCSDRHAINYLIQSTCSDILLDRAMDLDEFLEGSRSKVAFVMHDSVLIDFSKEDFRKLKKMKDLVSSTSLGDFVTNVKIGTNFGEMKELIV